MRAAWIVPVCLVVTSCGFSPAETAPPPTKGEQTEALERRIIETAEVDLATEDLEQGERDLLVLVGEIGGRVARSKVGGDAGTRRHGSWTVRVPVAKFREFLGALVLIGEALSVRTDSLDVTDEYVDLDARLAAKREEEKRMIRHLHESTASLADILSVERELARVRTEAEQLEGQLRAMAAKTDFATLVVTLEERVAFQAPVAPGLVAKTSRVFAESLSGLRAVGEACVLIAAALSPWLLAAAPFALTGHVLVRRWIRRGKRA